MPTLCTCPFTHSHLTLIFVALHQPSFSLLLPQIAVASFQERCTQLYYTPLPPAPQLIHHKKTSVSCIISLPPFLILRHHKTSSQVEGRLQGHCKSPPTHLQELLFSPVLYILFLGWCFAISTTTHILSYLFYFWSFDLICFAWKESLFLRHGYVQPKWNIALNCCCKSRELLLLTLTEIFSNSAVFLARSNSLPIGIHTRSCTEL